MTGALATRWMRPPTALRSAWLGPDRRVETMLADRPEATAVPTVIGPRGARGIAGPAGGVERVDATLAATWTLSHALGRVPLVQVYLANGEAVIADVVADAAQITVIFSQPTEGFVLIS